MLPVQETQVKFLVGELRSHMLGSAARNKKKKKKKKERKRAISINAWGSKLVEGLSPESVND